MKKFIIPLLILGIAHSTVSANEIDESRTKLSNEGVLVIYGELENKYENVLINLAVNKDDGNVLTIKQAVTDADGKYSFSVNLEELLDSGGKLYAKTVAQVEGEDTYAFEYYKKSELAQIIASIQGEQLKETGVDGIELILSGNEEIISFSNSEIKTILNSDKAGKIAEIIYYETLTTDNLISVLNKATAIIQIEDSTDYVKIKETFEKYQTDIEMDKIKDFSGITDEQKEKLYKKLASSQRKYNNSEQFYDDVYENIILMKLDESKGTQGIANILNTYSDKFDMKVFNSQGNDTSEVLKKIASAVEKSSVRSIEDIQKILDTKINKNSLSTGSSGGGGGGGYMSIQQKPVTFNEEEKVPTEEIKFEDLIGYEWAQENIMNLAKLKIISGYSQTEFKPANNITRAEFCKLICLAVGINTESISESAFNDVDKDSWYSPYVNALNILGIVKGFEDGGFNPDESITRQDISVIVYRAMQYKNAVWEDTGYQMSFKDIDAISDYAKEAIEKINEKKIVNGDSNGDFNPRNSASRAEAAMMIGAMYNYLNK